MAATTAHFTLEGEGLPADAHATRFESSEAVSEPYRIEIDFRTADSAFRVDACLRKRLRLVVVDARGLERFFDGLVDRAELLRAVGAELHFRVRLRPALAALEHREGCRIFQEKSIVQVVQTIFEDAGFADKVDYKLIKEYPPRELIVQYRESALNFVSRLLEEHGIFYFFSHTAEGHRMVVADDPGAFEPRDEAPKVLLTMAQGVAVGAEALPRFSRRRSLRTTDVHLRDYDFEKPQALPEAKLGAPDAAAAPHFEYPARFTQGPHGALLANARVRELRRDADVCSGRSRAILLSCGAPIVVDGAAEPCLNGEYVVTELTTRGHESRHDAGDVASVTCENEFRGIPVGAPYAPARRARRPRIRGIQTAIVTGSSEQEQSIHVDEYGRIKIRFFWDRTGQQDHTSSCWIRVSQIPVGASMILPRVGWEVSVAFLDGDPDRPLVLGRLYNAEKPPPCALPAGKASGSLKSYSSPGGGGHNELSMGDSGGSQGFGIHAQKDLNITTGHDRKEEVGVDEEHNVAVNESTSVGVDESIEIGGNQTTQVGAVLSHEIGGSQTIAVGGNDTSNAVSNYVEKVSGSRDYTVSGNQITISNGIEQTISGSFSRDVGAVQLVASVASISENVLGAHTDNVGAVKVHLVNGSHGEVVGGAKSQTSVAAEVHLTKGGLSYTCDASVTSMIGGLHYQKIDGDLVVKAPSIAIIGGVGVFKGAGSTLKLGGGPVVAKGSKIAIKAAMLVKLGGSLKMGPG
jgi:type VI secretion system secreted protein VgrG